MTADIINLRSRRKAKQRAQRDKIAAENRAVHGVSKAERAKTAAEAAKVDRVLDGAERTKAANEGAFPTTADAPSEDDLDPGNVS